MVTLTVGFIEENVPLKTFGTGVYLRQRHSSIEKLDNDVRLKKAKLLNSLRTYAFLVVRTELVLILRMRGRFQDPIRTAAKPSE